MGGPVLNRFLEGFVFHDLYKEALSHGGRVSNLQARVPSQIVFVDDREQNCLSVHHSLRSAVTFGIQLVTYQYTRVSYREARQPPPNNEGEWMEDEDEQPIFDNCVLNRQLQHLMSARALIGDDEARCLMRKEPAISRMLFEEQCGL